MKHISLAFLVIIFWIDLSAQNSSFNLLNDYGYLTYSFDDIVVADDTIVGIGSAYPDSSNLIQGIVLTQLDSNGVLLKSKIFFDPAGTNLFIPGNGEKIIKTSDGGYAFIAASVPRNDAYLYKVDRDFEIEFVKEYTDTVNIANFPYSLLETKNGYLLYGYNSTPDFQAFGFIRLVDKNGEKIWENQYFYGNYDTFFYDVDQINDTTFVAVAFINIDNSLFKNIATIRTFSITGNQLSYWESQPYAETGLIYEIIPVSDGGFITFGQNRDVWQGFTKLINQAYTKFDSNFNIEWIRHWYKPETVNGQREIQTLLNSIDGNFIGVGSGRSDNKINGVSYRVANIQKFSPLGDSIWNRSITIPESYLNPPYSQCYINAGGMLSSGSIIAGGEAIVDAAYYAWVIKITNDGCLDTLFVCSPTSAVRPVPAQDRGDVQLRPNPAHEEVTITYPVARMNGTLQVVDVYGRVVVTENIAAGQQRTTLQVTGVAAGLYIVTVKCGGVSIAKKLVIQ